MVSKGSKQHSCGCCRLPMKLPRRWWVVLLRPTRRPRLVAVCDDCFGHLGARALAISRVYGWFVEVVLEGHYDERAKKMRGLVGEGPVAGVAE